MIQAGDEFRFRSTACFSQRQTLSRRLAGTASLFFLLCAVTHAQVLVSNVSDFRQALLKAQPGTRIMVTPGTYAGGVHVANLRGESGRPIVIAAADPGQPPLFRGGGVGLQLSAPVHVELHYLAFTGQSGNGVNIDDAGAFTNSAHHITLRGLQVTDIGPGGNHDGLKLSGVAGFRIEGCTLQRWGTKGGSAIDLVGCHRGIIESNLFRHIESVGSTGVQAKGGSSNVIIRRNRFENAGGRAVNIGGSTGLGLFRPPLQPGQEHAEARDIRVEGNMFIGAGAPVAFVGVDRAVVRWNTIYRPKRWAFRILQENRGTGFVPCRNGEFTENLVVFHSSEWVQGGVNVGSGTAPETFQFARNWWYCLDKPARSRPVLPVPELNGVYGQPPGFRDEAAGDLRLRAESPARRVGAEAYQEPVQPVPR